MGKKWLNHQAQRVGVSGLYSTGSQKQAEHLRGQRCLTSVSVTSEEEMECVLIKFAGDVKVGWWQCQRTEMPFKGI